MKVHIERRLKDKDKEISEKMEMNTITVTSTCQQNSKKMIRESEKSILDRMNVRGKVDWQMKQ